MLLIVTDRKERRHQRWEIAARGVNRVRQHIHTVICARQGKRKQNKKTSKQKPGSVQCSREWTFQNVWVVRNAQLEQPLPQWLQHLIPIHTDSVVTVKRIVKSKGNGSFRFLVWHWGLFFFTTDCVSIINQSDHCVIQPGIWAILTTGFVLVALDKTNQNTNIFVYMDAAAHCSVVRL